MIGFGDRYMVEERSQSQTRWAVRIPCKNPKCSCKIDISVHDTYKEAEQATSKVTEGFRQCDCCGESRRYSGEDELIIEKEHLDADDLLNIWG